MDYAALAATSTRLLAQHGQDVTRRSFSVGVYDTTTGTATPTQADTTRKGAIFDFGAGVTLVRGTLIQVGDKRLLLDANGPVEPEDHFIVGGIDYSIVSIGEENPAGISVLFDLHVRR